MKFKTILLSISSLILCTTCFANTDYNISVKNSGGDFTTLSAAEAVIDGISGVDWTASTGTTKVFSFDANSGTIPSNTSCSTDGGTTTGTCMFQTSNQIVIYNISGGTFDDNDIVTDGTNTITLSDSGDLARPVITFYNDLTAPTTFDGNTYDSASGLIVQGDTSGTLELAWDGTKNGGVKITSGGYGGCNRYQDAYITARYYVCENGASPSLAAIVSLNNQTPVYLENIIVNNGGFLIGGGAPSHGFNLVSINSPSHGFSRNSGSSWPSTVNGEYFLTWYNCTAINAGDDGFSSNCGTNQGWSCYNCLSFGATNQDFDTTCFDNGSNAGSSDTTAANIDASTDVPNLTMSTEIVDGANGDVHLKSGSSLINAGVDKSSATGSSNDLDIVARTGTWDIGADEYSGGTPPPSYTKKVIIY